MNTLKWIHLIKNMFKYTKKLKDNKSKLQSSTGRVWVYTGSVLQTQNPPRRVGFDYATPTDYTVGIPIKTATNRAYEQDMLVVKVYQVAGNSTTVMPTVTPVAR